MSDLGIGFVTLVIIGAIIVFFYGLSKGEGFIESSKSSLGMLIAIPVIVIILIIIASIVLDFLSF